MTPQVASVFPLMAAISLLMVAAGVLESFLKLMGKKSYKPRDTSYRILKGKTVLKGVPPRWVPKNKRK